MLVWLEVQLIKTQSSVATQNSSICCNRRLAKSSSILCNGGAYVEWLFFETSLCSLRYGPESSILFTQDIIRDMHL
jgi:hypothetical protein